MKKIHINDDQLDGRKYARCGRTDDQNLIYLSDQFEATESRYRCNICEQYWFPYGQPDWHQQAALRRYFNQETM